MTLHNQMTGRLPYQQDAAATTKMVKNARMCRAYVIDRLFQQRVAAMKDLKESRFRRAGGSRGSTVRHSRSGILTWIVRPN
jgi:hypothetical protein